MAIWRITRSRRRESVTGDVIGGSTWRDRSRPGAFVVVGGALTAVLVTVALVAAGCDWAQWGGGPGHGFANPGEAALDVGSLEPSHQ